MPANSSLQSFFKTCRDHAAEVDETYWQHMGFASRMSARLFKAGAAALLHSIVPAWCETTASREISAMHEEITRRSSVN